MSESILKTARRQGGGSWSPAVAQDAKRLADYAAKSWAVVDVAASQSCKLWSGSTNEDPFKPHCIHVRNLLCFTCTARALVEQFGGDDACQYSTSYSTTGRGR